MGAVTETENGVTVVYESLQDFLAEDGDGEGGFDVDHDVEVDTADVGFDGVD